MHRHYSQLILQTVSCTCDHSFCVLLFFHIFFANVLQSPKPVVVVYIHARMGVCWVQYQKCCCIMMSYLSLELVHDQVHSDRADNGLLTV